MSVRVISVRCMHFKPISCEKKAKVAQVHTVDRCIEV